MKKIIDAYMHLDQCDQYDLQQIIEGDSSVEALIAVSWDLNSCKMNQKIALHYPQVKPAYGFHPEQLLPAEKDLKELLS